LRRVLTFSSQGITTFSQECERKGDLKAAQRASFNKGGREAQL